MLVVLSLGLVMAALDAGAVLGRSPLIETRPRVIGP